MPSRSRRSVYGVPGADSHGLESGRTSLADSLLLDLEGTVADGDKGIARDNVCAAVTANRDRSVYGDREIAVRINPASTPWHRDDLTAVCQARPDAVILPKVMSAADVLELEHLMNSAGEDARIEIWCMLETPSGVLKAGEILAATHRLTTALMGTNDLASELGTQPAADRGPLLYSLSHCVVAARVAGIAIIDGIYNRDDDGFAPEARQGRQLGFDGKLVGHASQVALANQLFGREE